MLGGEECRRLRFSGLTFKGAFLLADISFPILGVDFLRANKLLVDVTQNQSWALAIFFQVR